MSSWQQFFWTWIGGPTGVLALIVAIQQFRKHGWKDFFITLKWFLLVLLVLCLAWDLFGSRRESDAETHRPPEKKLVEAGPADTLPPIPAPSIVDAVATTNPGQTVR